MIRGWLSRLLLGIKRTRGSDNAPPSASAPTTEAERRLALALRTTRDETAMLRVDGTALAEKIRRNAARGRAAFEGKP